MSFSDRRSSGVGSIDEAPNDGNTYGRKNKSWVDLVFYGLPYYHIPSGVTVTVPVDRQHLLKGELVIEDGGELIVNGEAVTF